MTTVNNCICEDTCNSCQAWYGPGYTCDCGYEQGHGCWDHEDPFELESAHHNDAAYRAPTESTSASPSAATEAAT